LRLADPVGSARQVLVGAGDLPGRGRGDRAVGRLHPQARLLRGPGRARRGQRPGGTPGAGALTLRPQTGPADRRAAGPVAERGRCCGAAPAPRSILDCARNAFEGGRKGFDQGPFAKLRCGFSAKRCGRAPSTVPCQYVTESEQRLAEDRAAVGAQTITVEVEGVVDHLDRTLSTAREYVRDDAAALLDPYKSHH